ncbi:MAG: nucleoprotein/polynucleotide-associated enzyme [Pseudomonadales bacterium]|nr:nucleoprotein/polynucleotide-associated enzyme [Pseudomonadales bacterium]
MPSLQDQLLKAGVIDKQKSRKIKKEKQKAQKQGQSTQTPGDDAKTLAAQARAEKIERDRQINLQRQEQAQRKAIQAQIKQLITTARLPREGADLPYQFSHNQKIKKIYVTPEQQRQLVAGQLAIVESAGNYELVPLKAAEKIAQRDPACIIIAERQDETSVAEDDPYADYQIPDDLMW